MERNDLKQNGGLDMKIRLTPRGIAMVKKMNSEIGTLKVYKPNLKKFTLIKIDDKGRAVSRKKVMIDLNKYFKAS